MNKILYVRHGESEANKMLSELKKSFDKNNKDELDFIKTMINAKLTDLGEEQSIKTCIKLFDDMQYGQYKNYKNICILVSPYIRTQQTASKLLTLLDENNVSHNLMELVNIREYTGQHKIIPQNMKDKGVTHDLDWKAFVNRVKNFNDQLKELITSDGYDLVIVFSHGLFLSVLLGIQCVQEAYIGEQPISFELNNCSISELVFLNTNNDDNNNESNENIDKIEGKIWQINKVGDISHI